MIGQTASTPQPAGLGAISDAELRRLAAKRVADEIAAAKAPIISARAAAAAASKANQGALRGSGGAAASLMSGIAPGIQSGYTNAAGQISDMAGNFSAEAASRVRAAQAANDAFVASQVRGAKPSGVAPDATSLQDSTYAIQGFIPGSSLAAQGAAANAWGEALPGIEAVRTADMVQAEQGRAATEDHGYAQQLIDLAAKVPSMRTAALDELYKHELEKLNARLAIDSAKTQKDQFAATMSQNAGQFKSKMAQDAAQFASSAKFQQGQARLEAKHWDKNYAAAIKQAETEQSRWEQSHSLDVQKFNEDVARAKQQYGIDLRAIAIQERAQTLYERTFGEVTLPKSQAEIANMREQTKIAWGSLKLDRSKFDQAISDAILQGKRIDAPASRVAGHIVYKDGSEDASIPVKATASTTDKYQAAVAFVPKLRGKPIENPSPNPILSPGKYIAAPGAKGVFPQKAGTAYRTTNDPQKAMMGGGSTFAEASARLQEQFGLTAAQARKALIVGNGWKPDGARTTK